MISLPPAGAFAPEAATNEQAGINLENFLGFVRNLLGASSPEFITISGGVITPNQGYVVVDTESAASSDDLDRISTSNRPNGSIIVLRCLDGVREVRLRNLQGGVGQMQLRNGADGDYRLKDAGQHVMLMLHDNIWWEMFRWYGSRVDLFRAYLGLAAGALMPEASQAEARAGTAADRIVTPRRVLDALNTYEVVFGAVGTTSRMNPNAELVVGLAPSYNSGVSAIARLQLSKLLSTSFAYYFESNEIDYNLSTSGTVDHGFGASPRLVYAVLRCKTAQYGYGPGDEVRVDSNYSSDHTRLLSVGAASNGAFWSFGDYPLVIAAYGTGNGSAITPANWKLVIRAWR